MGENKSKSFRRVQLTVAILFVCLEIRIFFASCGADVTGDVVARDCVGNHRGFVFFLVVAG